MSGIFFAYFDVSVEVSTNTYDVNGFVVNIYENHFSF